MKSLSRVRLFATSWTIAFQAPMSMGFSRQYTGVDCHFLLQGIFPTQGLNPGLLHYRQTLYHLSHQGLLSLKIVHITNTQILMIHVLTVTINPCLKMATVKAGDGNMGDSLCSVSTCLWVWKLHCKGLKTKVSNSLTGFILKKLTEWSQISRNMQ